MTAQPDPSRPKWPESSLVYYATSNIADLPRWEIDLTRGDVTTLSPRDQRIALALAELAADRLRAAITEAGR